jgi:hypothetical protein
MQEVSMRNNSFKKVGKQQRVVKAISLTHSDLKALDEIERRINYSTDARMLNHSEIMRAGLLSLLELTSTDLARFIEAVPRLMPGPLKGS